MNGILRILIFSVLLIDLFLSTKLVGFIAKASFIESESIVEEGRVIQLTNFGNSKKTIPLNSKFYDRSFFELNAKNIISNSENEDGIRAIIAPHHLLVSELIARSLMAMSGRSIKTVVVIGPDHENKGGAPIISGDFSWETPFGIIEPDTKPIRELLQNSKVFIGFDTLASEHSVGVFMPYIKKSYPNASVIPILFSSYANEGDCEYVADFLTKFDPNTTRVIFSIDFSHYLSEALAYEKDRETLNLIGRGDYSKILPLTSDHLDSPATLVTALIYFAKNNLSFDLLYHKNSNDYLSSMEKITTSYIGFIAKASMD